MMRPRTKKSLLIAACYAGVLIIGMALGPRFSKENSNTRNGTFLPFTGGRAGKVDKVLQIIGEKYVDPVKVDTLQNLAIQDILKKLDPHSAYLPPEDAQLLHDDLEGNFNGIGVEYYMLNDTLLITAVNPGGPASKAGLKRGDQVIRIGTKNIAGTAIKNKQVVELMRGERGSQISLTIKRRGLAQPAVLTVVRNKITISSIDVAYMLDSQCGYIKITKFGAKTGEDFVNALSSLQKSGMKALVLDLRGNGGGYLNAATALADQFLPNKKLIVYTQGEHEPRTDYLATGEGIFEQGGLVVLIDENTASASEIVAGAVQDLDRGTIIGRRSFGKGLVQEQFDFGDGSALNLTIARYYTPLGRSIQRSYKKGADAYYEEVHSRFKNGELSSAGKYSDSLYDKNKVYKTASGRAMYGGGGIMPDIYVPVDTSGFTDFYYEIALKGILHDFVFSNLLLPQAPASLSSFIQNYKVTDAQYSRLVAIAKEKGLSAPPAQVQVSKTVIMAELKASIARYYFGDEGYYRVINTADKAIARALETLSGERKKMPGTDSTRVTAAIR